MAASKRIEGLKKRKRRIRAKISGTPQRPRLTVFKSLKQIYVQVIDDVNGTTLAAGSSQKSGEKLKSLKNIKAAESLGESIADDMLKKGINTVVFDRNGYNYHGKVKALAEKIREKGVAC